MSSVTEGRVGIGGGQTHAEIFQLRAEQTVSIVIEELKQAFDSLSSIAMRFNEAVTLPAKAAVLVEMVPVVRLWMLDHVTARQDRLAGIDVRTNKLFQEMVSAVNEEISKALSLSATFALMQMATINQQIQKQVVDAFTIVPTQIMVADLDQINPLILDLVTEIAKGPVKESAAAHSKTHS